MHIKKLKIKLSIKILVILSLITVCFFFTSNEYEKLSLLDRKKTSEDLRLKKIKDKINHFNTKTEDIANALATWKYVTSEVQHFKGLQLRKAKDLLDEMKTKHNLNQLDIKLSKPEIQKGRLKGVKVGVESTTLQLKIRCYSDIQIFNFLYDLLIMLPGYPQTIKLSINKSHDLNETNLYRIARDSRFSPVLSEIDIRWNDLKILANE